MSASPPDAGGTRSAVLRHTSPPLAPPRRPKILQLLPAVSAPTTPTTPTTPTGARAPPRVTLSVVPARVRVDFESDRGRSLHRRRRSSVRKDGRVRSEPSTSSVSADDFRPSPHAALGHGVTTPVYLVAFEPHA